MVPHRETGGVTSGRGSAGARRAPAVGLAYSDLVRSFVRRHGSSVDYLEVPFELLRHDPAVFEDGLGKPVVLHCASLSVAGAVLCPEPVVEEIRRWAERTGTPWIGEHLAFVTANRVEGGRTGQPYAPGEPYNIGYTVSPPMNEDTLERVAENVTSYASRFDVPLLLENSPLYFRVPGSTMTQTEFIGALCARVPVGLLLDLSHLYITSRTMDFDVLEELERLPLERVEEIHVSGVDEQPDGAWDDHANRAPAIVHRLLARALERAAPRAITLEYNWSARFPPEVLRHEIARVRRTVARSRGQHRDADPRTD